MWIPQGRWWAGPDQASGQQRVQCTKREVELPQSKRGIWIQDCSHRPPLVVPSWRKRQFPTVGGRFPTEIEPAY